MADRYNHPTIHEQMLGNRSLWHRAPTKAHPYYRGGATPVVEGSAQHKHNRKPWQFKAHKVGTPRAHGTYRAARREELKQQRREAKRARNSQPQ